MGMHRQVKLTPFCGWQLTCKWITPLFICIYSCGCQSIIMPSKSPVSVPFTFLGETQCVSQVMIGERWSIHPIPKLKERNLENSISIRFLDDNTALIDVDSSVWEITAILGHPDNDSALSDNNANKKQVV